MNFLKVDEFTELYNRYLDFHISKAKMVELLNAKAEEYADAKIAHQFDKVNRIEVINHVKDTPSKGRVFVHYLEVNAEVECQLQDDNKTLKIFLTDKK